MSVLRTLLTRLRNFFNEPVLSRLVGFAPPDAASQLMLQMAYRNQALSGVGLPPVSEVGFKAFSQTDEDGILLYIFSLIGTSNRKCAEICAGSGVECNTANLIINHGWSGLLVDGDVGNVKRGLNFYKTNPATYVDPPVFKHAWITRENVNSILEDNGFSGKIDLLSIDMDGVDYWIWDAIKVADPRVVVVEYQDIIGPDLSLTVPYAEDFSSSQYSAAGKQDFRGASLRAFVKMAASKGYRLVGCNRYGYNAFFVQKGEKDDLIPEIPLSECFRHSKVLSGMLSRWPKVKDMPWVEV